MSRIGDTPVCYHESVHKPKELSEHVESPQRRSTDPNSLQPTTGPSALAREGIPLSTLPARNPEYESPSSVGSTTSSGSASRSASIGKSVVIKGQLFAREDLFIDGEIEGAVEMLENRITVGPNGKVVAGIKAREIVVLGTIHGNVRPLTRSRFARTPNSSATYAPRAS